jgi:hypothetical protein
MTQVSPGGPPPLGSLSVPVGERAWAVSRWRTPTARRYLFGYTLLAPAVLYVALLVGVPFVFSLYLAMSDAAVGAPVARFIGLENFASALENAVFYTAVRNTLVFTVGAGILKGLSSPATLQGAQDRPRAHRHPVHAADRGQRAGVEMDVRFAVQRHQLGAESAVADR